MKSNNYLFMKRRLKRVIFTYGFQMLYYRKV